MPRLSDLRRIRREASERVAALELPFNRHGLDPFGVSRSVVRDSLTLGIPLYRRYLSVRSFGAEHVPRSGRAMLVGNHSGGVALDGAMIWVATMLELNPPRLAQGMAEKFLNQVPFSSPWTSRLGHLTGLPEHAVRLLEDDRLLMVFPEGARGTAKLYPQRHSLVRFGTGFMRLALQTGSPIVPVAFLGGGEAIPTIVNSKTLGRMVGAPYVPFTPWVVALPRPVPCEIYFGKPLSFEGDGTEPDDEIQARVDTVSSVIGELIEQGVRRRREGFDAPVAWPEVQP